MKVYVMSADRKSGVGKKSQKPYDNIVAQIVYQIGQKFAVKELWLDPEMIGGSIPVYGDILDVQVDLAGYVQAVSFVENERFALNVHKKQ